MLRRGRPLPLCLHRLFFTRSAGIPGPFHPSDHPLVSVRGLDHPLEQRMGQPLPTRVQSDR
ncbi:hypothetical protein D187_007962 [Cystobacter fuscus DSM 2262]|uniref:Uncharacterized protein n=1 Tax=Cystobacter fuscus (strain ATCC 25194 / DSM 2262 / NBRC 100088 / M29) TaxID=1242864 RepID=S9NWS3_CYSF2|nr:hypothetical protein D187_007962 [Cystobacter fuscus DSM 2262]